jgi:hypothetical protein
MDYTESAVECHVNSHIGLSDSVHGRRHQRGLDFEALSNLAFQADLYKLKSYL